MCVNNCYSQEDIVPLPQISKKGTLSLEEVLNTRKSVRDYKSQPLTPEDLSNILWAAYGENKWRKTTPSAGALYPLYVYALVGEVENLEKGVYLYNPDSHSIKRVSKKDIRAQLSNAALSQGCVREAPLVLVICADYKITTVKYGERGMRYVIMEVGFVGQNIYLMAQSLGLGTVAVGAFSDKAVKDALGIKEEPLLIMPVGKPRK